MANKSLTFDIIGRDKSASKTLQNVGRSSGNLARSFLKLGAALVGALALRRVVQFGKVAVQEFAQAQESQERLTDAFARFPKTADLNIKALRDLNTALQNKTKFDDDALAAAQASLAQYDLTGKQIETLTPLLADFAAKTGKDLPSAANTLGKALLGQGRGLKEIGVDFKDAGSVTENYTQLVDILSDKVGGFAEKQGKTFAGQLEILTNQFGELKEKIGSVFAPALGHLAKLMGDQVLPLFDRFVTVVGPKLSAIFDGGAAKLAEFFTAFTTGVNTGNWGPLTDFFAKAAPLLPTIADGFLKIASALTQEGAVEAISTLVTEVLPPLVDLLVALTPLIPPLAGVITTVLVPAIDTLSQGISGITALFSGNIDTQRAWLRQIQTVGGPLGDSVRWWVKTIVGGFNTIIDVANFVRQAIENVVNAFSALTGVSIHLPNIPHVNVGGTLLGTSTAYKPGTFGSPGGSGGNGGGTNTKVNAGMFAEGGLVQHRPGGMLGVIGEGRHDEVVLPLSNNVLSQLGGGGTQITIQLSGVYAGTKNDLAKTIRQALVDGRKNGAIPAGAI